MIVGDVDAHSLLAHSRLVGVSGRLGGEGRGGVRRGVARMEGRQNADDNT